MVSFAHPLPWWAVALVVAARRPRVACVPPLLGAGRLAASRSPDCAFSRCSSLVLVLMRPVVHHSTVDGRDVVVPILVDTSRSMAIDDADGARRIDRARDFVKSQLLPALGGRFQVDVLSFGEALAPASADSFSATARRSDLGGALAGDPGAISRPARRRCRSSSAMAPIPAADRMSLPWHRRCRRCSRLASARSMPAATGRSSASRPPRRCWTARASTLTSRRSSSGRTDDAVELRLLENGRPREVRHVRVAGGRRTDPRDLPGLAPGRRGDGLHDRDPRRCRRAGAREQQPQRARPAAVAHQARAARRGRAGIRAQLPQARTGSGDRGLEIDSVVRKGKNEQGADTYYVQATRGRGAALATGYPADAADAVHLRRDGVCQRHRRAAVGSAARRDARLRLAPRRRAAWSSARSRS